MSVGCAARSPAPASGHGSGRRSDVAVFTRAARRSAASPAAWSGNSRRRLRQERPLRDGKPPPVHSQSSHEHPPAEAPQFAPWQSGRDALNAVLWSSDHCKALRGLPRNSNRPEGGGSDLAASSGLVLSETADASGDSCWRPQGFQTGHAGLIDRRSSREGRPGLQ
jgi:hypothetical protein